MISEWSRRELALLALAVLIPARRGAVDLPTAPAPSSGSALDSRRHVPGGILLTSSSDLALRQVTPRLLPVRGRRP